MQLSEVGMIEDAFLDLEDALADKAWKLEHDQAMRCRMLEERMRRTLPKLMRLDAFLNFLSRFPPSGTQDQLTAFRQTLSNLAMRVFDIYELMTNWIDEVQGAGYEIEGVAVYTVGLTQLVETVISLSKYLEVVHFGLPPGGDFSAASARWSMSLGGPSGNGPHSPQSDSQANKSPGDGGDPKRAEEAGCGRDPIGEALEKLGSMRRGVPVKALPGSIRLPDLPPETDEGPAPFDLPFIGERKRVKTRLGRLPLPDPIDFEGI